MSAGDPTGERGQTLARDLLLLLGGKQRTFLGFLRTRTRSETDAEELLQRAFLKAAEKIDSLRDHERLDAWFYRILRRTVADSLARKALENEHLEELRMEVETGTHEQVAVCACSLGLLERLRPEYREMLRRVDIEEDAIAEVAASLGLTANNATVRLHRARAAMRAELLRFCNARSVASCSTCACETSVGPSGQRS